MAKKWDVSEVTDLVARIYDQIQEREPDENGQLYWSGFLTSGELSVKQVIHYITESDEYKGRFITGLPIDQAVEKSYEHFLGRKANEADINHYVEVAKKNGMPTVIAALMGSQEYQQNFGEDGVPPKVQ